MTSSIVNLVVLVCISFAGCKSSGVDVDVSKVTGMANGVDSLSTVHYLDIRERMDHLDDKICNSEKKLTEIKGNFPLLESKIENMELKFRLELLEQFSTLMAGLKGLGFERKAVNPALNVHSPIQNSAHLEAKLDNISSHILKVEDEVRTLQEATTRLDGKLYSLSEKSDVCVRALIENRNDNCSDADTLSLQEAQASAWVTILRRMDGAENFTRGWADYKSGFGDLGAEFWLGLEDIHQLTAVRTYRLRVALTDFSGAVKFAEYSQFYIRGEADNYRLHVTGYVPGSTAGDSLKYHNEMPFTTLDRDNDKHVGNCAVSYKGGWWYNSCHYVNPTGLYLGADSKSTSGINWLHAYNDRRSFKRLELSIRHV